MATVIGVIGESGSGKTTSLRNLDPATTYIIDADGKGLCWRGWRNQYNKAAKNYSRIDMQQRVVNYMRYANDQMPHIKTVVVDTINGVMVAEERAHKDEKNYDKWADLAWNIWDIITYANTMRDDMVVVLCAHSETVDDDNGRRFTRILTNGRKLNKLKPETKMRAVLHAYRDDDGNYVFGVHARDSIAKVPFGLYDDVETVPNDLAKVIADFREFDGSEPDGEVDDAESEA